MTNVMKRAWEIAKKGQEKFGGKASEYLSEALKMSWKIEKQKNVKVDRMMEIVGNLDNNTVDVKVIKNGRVIKEVIAAEKQESMQFMADHASMYPTMDYYMIKDGQKHYRGRKEAKVRSAA